MTTLLYSYNPHSRSGRELAQGLGIRRVRHQGSRWRPGENDRLINWGASEFPVPLLNTRTVNSPGVVATVSNKLSFFEGFYNENLPPYTVDMQEAREWSRTGHAVVCRTVLRGHSGAGIVVALTEDQLVPAPLYTQYIKKRDEYRVHITREGGIFDIQKKAKILEREDVNWYVRNYHNGFIYRRNDLEVPEVVRTVALDVFNRTSLDFGAVDVIYNANQRRAYVLEINTAPGLSGTTLTNYIETFRRWV